MRIQYITLLALVLCTNINAQSNLDEYKRQRKEELKQYKENVKTEFEKYREKRNAEFAALLSQRWSVIKKQNAMKPPIKPEPVKPVIKDNTIKDTPPVKIPIGQIVSIPKPKPRIPLSINPLPQVSPQFFKSNFYGTDIFVNLKYDKHKFRLNSAQETEVGKIWSWLSDGKMDEVVDNLLSWRESMKLNDYTYSLLVAKVCNDFFGNNGKNEAVLMQSYILTQCGYDLRMARKNSDLVLLLPINENVYGKSYFTIGGKRYYVVNDTKGNGDYYTFSQSFSPQSQTCSALIKEPVILESKNPVEKKTFVSEKYPNIRVETSVDKNLMQLYNDYPILDWDIYADTPMSKELSKSILPQLKQAVSGKSEEVAVEMILNFVQTAFKYMTDNEQFGYERPFFVDELFFYPYSDCEDRAILFSYLIRNIMGLDVVLLNYPNHLATAVKLSSYSNGDYVNVNNKRFTICDPTYINAGIGETMPQFKNSKAKVIILKN